MEERRTNKHGLGLALSVRREKFGHISGILCFCGWPERVLEQNSHTATWNADLSSRICWPGLWVHRFQLLLQQLPLSNCYLSLTVTHSSLFTALGPCLSSFSSSLVGNLARKPFVWVSRQNRQRHPLIGSHSHPCNKCSPSCYITRECLFTSDNTLRNVFYEIFLLD